MGNEAKQGVLRLLRDRYVSAMIAEERMLRMQGANAAGRYIIWDNLFRLLDTLDPETPLYMGSPSPGRMDERRDQKTWFANGGPGYILSRGAMKKLLARRVGATGTFIDPPLTERFRHLAHDGECCGDSILGFAAWETGIFLQGFYPLFTPYVLKALPFNDAHWCYPLVTMHKVATEEMVKLWKWEFENRKHGVSHHNPNR